MGHRSLLKVHRWSVRLLGVLVLVTVALLAVQALPPTRHEVQGIDDFARDVAVSSRLPPLTWLALALNVLGGAWVTIPVRAGVTVLLAVRKRWWFLGAFLIGTEVSELVGMSIKLAYARGRPPARLVATTGYSFPSGHTLITAALVMMLVLVFVAPGGRRRVGMLLAIAFTLVMGLSRVYLSAHWLSDAVTSGFLGNSIALGSALLVQAIHDRVTERVAPATDTDRGPLADSGVEPNPAAE